MCELKINWNSALWRISIDKNVSKSWRLTYDLIFSTQICIGVFGKTSFGQSTYRYIILYFQHLTNTSVDIQQCNFHLQTICRQTIQKKCTGCFLINKRLLAVYQVNWMNESKCLCVPNKTCEPPQNSFLISQCISLLFWWESCFWKSFTFKNYKTGRPSVTVPWVCHVYLA